MTTEQKNLLIKDLCARLPYIWTLVDSNIIIEDKQVVNWTDFGI